MLGPRMTLRRTVFELDGRQFVFKSNHPLEERIVYLDDLPRDAFGSIVLPDEPWDGVETNPGVVIAGADPRDEWEVIH